MSLTPHLDFLVDFVVPKEADRYSYEGYSDHGNLRKRMNGYALRLVVKCQFVLLDKWLKAFFVNYREICLSC